MTTSLREATSARRRAFDRTFREQLLRQWRDVSHDEERVAGCLQVPSHGPAHDAEPNEADLGQETPPPARYGRIQPRPASVVVAGAYSQPTQPS